MPGNKSPNSGNTFAFLRYCSPGGNARARVWLTERHLERNDFDSYFDKGPDKSMFDKIEQTPVQNISGCQFREKHKQIVQIRNPHSSVVLNDNIKIQCVFRLLLNHTYITGCKFM